MGRKASKRLTPKGVLALTDEGYSADSEAVGLYVQVAYRQKGGKRDPAHGVTRSWVYRFTSPLNRRVRWMGLGSCDVIPLADARDLARAARKLVTYGADPIEHRRATQEAERQAYLKERASKMTFRECVDGYLDGRLDAFKNAKHRWQWRETLDRASAAFGDLHVAEIDTPVIVRFLEPIWRKTPETAARIRGRIEKVLAWATTHQFRSGPNPAAWRGHLDTVFVASKGGNFEAMPFHEVPAFMAGLIERDSISARALEFAILTAARSGEVRGATWSEINLDKAQWTISAERMKAGREHTVPLSKRAVALLKALPRIEGQDYVFPGAVAGRPLSDMALMALLRGMDANGYKVHGFRSSFRDWAGDTTEFDREVIEHALAHKLPDRVEAAYRRTTALEKRRILMQAWADHCAGIAKDTANVVPMYA